MALVPLVEARSVGDQHRLPGLLAQLLPGGAGQAAAVHRGHPAHRAAAQRPVGGVLGRSLDQPGGDVAGAFQSERHVGHLVPQHGLRPGIGALQQERGDRQPGRHRQGVRIGALQAVLAGQGAHLGGERGGVLARAMALGGRMRAEPAGHDRRVGGGVGHHPAVPPLAGHDGADRAHGLLQRRSQAFVVGATLGIAHHQHVTAPGEADRGAQPGLERIGRRRGGHRCGGVLDHPPGLPLAAQAQRQHRGHRGAVPGAQRVVQAHRHGDRLGEPGPGADRRHRGHAAVGGGAGRELEPQAGGADRGRPGRQVAPAGHQCRGRGIHRGGQRCAVTGRQSGVQPLYQGGDRGPPGLGGGRSVARGRRRPDQPPEAARCRWPSPPLRRPPGSARPPVPPADAGSAAAPGAGQRTPRHPGRAAASERSRRRGRPAGCPSARWAVRSRPGADPWAAWVRRRRRPRYHDAPRRAR